ncbi:MAG TPA: sigma-70 family RNA polymerase sigma factor [Acidimicrobiia bacterium]|nr:sigma-70 family RNA polymerase sigma factor [Acidimicrobiia bacterium]
MKRRAESPDNAGDAFDVLFRREFGPITRTAYLIVGDWEVAREIAQDAFVQVLRHWKKVQEVESPGGWVRRVAIRDAVRTRRRDARGRRLLRTVASGFAEESEFVSGEVRHALLTLPRQQRAVIALHYLEDRTVAEIATLLGCSEGSVKTHLSRGRAALASRLGEVVTDDPR